MLLCYNIHLGDDMELWKELFKNNINIYLWLSILTSFVMFAQLDMNRKNSKIKIIIVYVLFYLLAVCKVLKIRYLIIVFLCVTFVFLEFIFEDEFKKKILKRASFYFWDYFYQIIYEYNFFYFLFAISLVSNASTNFCQNILDKFGTIDILNSFNINYYDYYSVFSLIISIPLLIIGIIKIINEEFEVYNFKEIKEKIDNIMPFYDFQYNTKLFDFSNILIYQEDRSYFLRAKSYNWISLEFILYRFRRIYEECFTKKYNGNRILHVGANLISFFLYIIVKIIVNMILFIKKVLKIFINVFIERKGIQNFMRGYSTIEMQLIRTFAVKHGYSLHVFRRKVYELIYSKIFFTSLREYYEYHHYSNLEQYKYYLIYLYIMVAPVKINDITYRNILAMYKKKKVNDITIEEFYVWTYGLSHRPINDSLMNEKLIEMFNMDKVKLRKIIKKFS